MTTTFSGPYPTEGALAAWDYEQAVDEMATATRALMAKGLLCAAILELRTAPELNAEALETA